MTGQDFSRLCCGAAIAERDDDAPLVEAHLMSTSVSLLFTMFVCFVLVKKVDV